MDEPCLLLSEQHLQAPGSRGWRRYQILHVMRGDKPAEFRRDMGPASKFKHVDPFRIPGGARDADTGRYHVEHTVGELIDIADFLREVHVAPKPEPTSGAALATRLHETLNRRRRRARGAVSVAPRIIRARS